MLSIRTQHCTNCGLNGHVFRNCQSPVTSYGLIAVRYGENQTVPSVFSKALHLPSRIDSLEFLLIQRKDSLSFVVFIRGKYNLNESAYIITLLKGMTSKEQQALLTRSFDQLWHDVWGDSAGSRSHRSEYESSDRKFSQLASRLPEWIQENPSRWVEPEWGFPKGRRNPYESDIHCALREFQEESGIRSSDISLIQNTHSIAETFVGSNQVHYCHKYYIAVCNQMTEATMNQENFYMMREVGAIQWCSLEDAIAKIRPDNVEKREILLKAGKIMKNFHPVVTGETTY
jgi:8-oxo-dGTP pyrophosphatase MutT (NUDIX family)